MQNVVNTMIGNIITAVSNIAVKMIKGTFPIGPEVENGELMKIVSFVKDSNGP